MDMDLVVILCGIFAIVTGLPIARALARRLERTAMPTGDMAEIRQRLEAIEQAVDSIAIEVERVAEAQRFATKLLASPEARSVAALPVPASRPAEQRTPH